jgi:glucan biosynthesis protein C
MRTPTRARHPAAGAAGGVAPASRLPYVDTLRVLALAGVFVVHAVSPFDPWDRWHIQNAERSRLLGEVVLLMAPWLMPLVMLLAGVSAWHALRRRANAAYLRERAARLLLPLAVGMVLLVPPQVWLERRLAGRFDGSLLEFYPHVLEGVYPRGNFAWHHLWFLAYLLVLAVGTLPLFRFLQGARGHRLLGRIARLCSGPGGLLWLSLPLVLERHLLSPFLTGDRLLFADWSNRGLLPAAYVYGFVLAGERWLGEAIDREWRWALAGALATTTLLGMAAWHGLLPGRVPPPFTVGYLAFWALYAVGAWSWMVAALGMGRRWLHGRSALVRYGSDTGAAFYLVHQPVIVAAAYGVVQWSAPLPAKLGALVVLSLGGTLLVVEALRRLPRVGALFGLRARPA